MSLSGVSLPRAVDPNNVKAVTPYSCCSEIRRKLGIDEHETDIGIYVRKLLRQL